MEYIRIQENGIHIVFGITEKRQLKLLHFSKNQRLTVLGQSTYSG